MGREEVGSKRSIASRPWACDGVHGLWRVLRHAQHGRGHLSRVRPQTPTGYRMWERHEVEGLRRLRRDNAFRQAQMGRLRWLLEMSSMRSNRLGDLPAENLEARGNQILVMVSGASPLTIGSSMRIRVYSIP